jgi:hypothetical protein
MYLDAYISINGYVGILTPTFGETAQTCSVMENLAKYWFER